MAIEFAAFGGAITQGVARILGLSKTARMRRAVRDHILLYGTLSEHEGLKSPADRVAALLDFQVGQLADREFAAAQRTYDWGGVTVGLFFAGLFALPMIWLVPPNGWWQWVLVVLLGFPVVVFLAVTASMFGKRPTVAAPAAATNETR